jgi:hypothetical protein
MSLTHMKDKLLQIEMMKIEAFIITLILLTSDISGDDIKTSLVEKNTTQQGYLMDTLHHLKRVWKNIIKWVFIHLSDFLH